MLLVGLGNPGGRYTGTRHNVGFDVIAQLCARWGAAPAAAAHGATVCSAAAPGGRPTTLARPQQYMNRSGGPVAALLTALGLAPEQLVVIHDDMGLSFGTVRCRLGGGHGGHNGLRDIIARIGRGFLRVRVGIGRPPEGVDAAEHVLGRWADPEQAALGELLDTSSDATEVIVTDGLVAAQNRFNVRPMRAPAPQGAPPSHEPTPNLREQ